MSYRTRQPIRLATAALMVVPMKIIGFRFSKLYRHGASPFHARVYRWVDTIQANVWAGI